MVKKNSQKTNELYQFGAFQLDAKERRLWREDERIQLTPKQFDLLFYFVENAGRVAKKDELLNSVWADTFVEETTLARNVSWLRKILGDGADGESIIETVPKIGYRFTAEVTQPTENVIIIEEKTIEYSRGEETITFNEAELTKVKETKPAKSFAFSALLILLVFLSLVAGGGYFLYRNNLITVAMSPESSAKAKTKIEKIEINTAREISDSGIKIQRGDMITFSIAGEYKYGPNQIWTYEGDKNAEVSNSYMFEKAAPWSLVGWIGTETDQSKYFQVSKINSLMADRNGSLFFAINKPQNDYTKNIGIFIADVALVRYIVNERPQIKIGSVINLQNRYPNVGSYLDAWGTAWSKPEFAKITTENKFVSTHYNPNRDNGSGSWEIVSADGKNNGEPLTVGDRIHLRNKFPDAGYLDSCGWVEHLPIFKDFKDQKTAIFTTQSPNRDYGSGTWIVRSATESDGSSILEGDNIALENGFIVVVEGKVYKVGFLNASGNVRDIPSFNDYDGSGLVFSLDVPSNQSIPDIWTIMISKAVSE